jgi:hypothetical protein
LTYEQKYGSNPAMKKWNPIDGVGGGGIFYKLALRSRFAGK